jgi:molecular chaperone GrpE
VSKKDPARTDLADKPQSEPVELGNPNADDPDAEGLEGKEEARSESDQPRAGREDRGPSEIERLRAELAEAEERALRTQAELENYRKRAARQMDEQRRYANMPLIRDLLPVWDNMGRAIEAAEKSRDAATLLEGFKMVAGQLESVLQQHHCTKIDALGERFDPNVHEAISQQPSREHPANTVLGVAQTGFRLHDRVVRPSQVIVSAAMPQKEGKKGPAPPGEEPPEADQGPHDAAADAE